MNLIIETENGRTELENVGSFHHVGESVSVVFDGGDIAEKIPGHVHGAVAQDLDTGH